MVKREADVLSIDTAIAMMDRAVPANSAGTLRNAERLELASGYCIDGYQVDVLFRYFFESWRLDKNQNTAIYALIWNCFKLGYLKGGRAAIAGKFKEPPRRRKNMELAEGARK